MRPGRPAGADPLPALDPALLAGLQLAIGHEFRDADLLDRALTHRSFRNERPDVGADNERLEFLGDAVLELLVSEWLFETYPKMPEGQLTQMRARIVDEDTLAGLARNLHVGGLLRVGVGEERSGGRQRRSLLADAFEAVLGAVFLDAGFDASRRVVRRLFEGRLRGLEAAPPKDAKSLLQEWSQAVHRVTPVYRLLASVGPDHDAVFEAEVVVADVLTARGRGPSKKDAQRQAARNALEAVGLLGSGGGS